MSKTKIPPKVIQELWVVAGGRCEFAGCNKILWYDIATKRNCNSAYIAHIVADEPGGPRGDAVLSPQLCKSIENLMLCCDTHHRMIDADEATYTRPILMEMKAKHEERITYLTSLKDIDTSHVVIYTPNIGNHVMRVAPDVAAKAILPKHYPADKAPIELSNVNSAFTDSDESFWITEGTQLNRKFESDVKRRIIDGTIKHISVFALAPQPLLIELGRLLCDIQSIEVYQKHREPDTWEWLEEAGQDTYTILKPAEIYDTVALNLSLSASIDNERIIEILGPKTSIWTITIEKPNNDFLRNRQQSEAFRKVIRQLYNEIKLTHGQNSKIHVFPACPNSIAIDIGRTWMPKADLPLVIYDQNNKHHKFIHSLDIEAPV